MIHRFPEDIDETLPMNGMRRRIALQVNALHSFRSNFTHYDMCSFCSPSLS